MRETWYVLEDGSSADPRKVAPDDKGVMRHENGMAVAIGSHGNPRSRGVELDGDGREMTAGEKKPVARDRQIKAKTDEDPKYKTR